MDLECELALLGSTFLEFKATSVKIEFVSLK
jgi:hypothetical protein